tara:strand:+ start:2728 stop:3450 length:723 start_codon:yes stop_codon:yes gene_type:complete
MKFEFRTVIYPSGYSYSEQHGTIHPKKHEYWEERSIDFNELVNDVWQKFKHIEIKEDSRNRMNFLGSTKQVSVGGGWTEDLYIPNEEAIEKVKTLALNYGLDNGPRVYWEDAMERRRGRPYDALKDWFTKNRDVETHLALSGDYWLRWEDIIFKIIYMRLYPHANKFIEIDDVKIVIANDELRLLPQSLFSAISCYTEKRGLAPCSNCGSPYLRKRSNSLYCSKSCKTIASRNRRAISPE